MSETYLRRYTDIPSLVGMLTHGELILLEPSSWDDKNDSYFIEQYKEKCALKSVLALCFTRAAETYHHWRVFSSGSSGVCVWFKEDILRRNASEVPRVRIKPVEYLTIEKIRKEKVTVSKLPFLKRQPFKPEREVRMLWESDKEQRSSLSVPFESAAISRITLSPWIHPSLADPVRSLLKSLPECRNYKIYRSTLVGNTEWKTCGREAT